MSEQMYATCPNTRHAPTLVPWRPLPNGKGLYARCTCGAVQYKKAD